MELPLPFMTGKEMARPMKVSDAFNMLVICVYLREESLFYSGA